MRLHARRIFPLLLMMCPGLSGMLWASTPSSSQTALHLSSNSVPIGTPVTLTANVTSEGTPVRPGLVKFCNADAKYCKDASILGQAQLTNAGTATVKLKLAPGQHHIKAVFQGTKEAAGSSSAEDLVTVTGKYPTVTSINASGSQGLYTLTGSVASFGTLTGRLSFQDATQHSTLASGQLTTSAGLRTQYMFGVTPPEDYSSGTNAGIVADLNGDGQLDEVLFNGDVQDPNTYISGIAILLGNGDGTFQLKSTPVVGSSGATAQAVAAGDFNSDGIIDLAVANAGDSNIYILLGKGDGTFSNTSPVSALTPDSQLDFVSADFDSDGNVDLAIASGSQLEILLGKGDGTFTPLAVQAVPSPNQLVVSDFNRDGRADLVMVNGGPSVFLGNGDGTFTEAPPISISDKSYGSVTAGDFNGDGIPDIAVGNSGYQDEIQNVPGYVDIYEGKGDGTFSFKSSFSSYSVYVDVGDFNGDGILDIATLNGGYDGNLWATAQLGAGDGTFPSAWTYSFIGGATSKPLALGDFNGDGKTDLSIPLAWATELPAMSGSLTVNSVPVVGSIGTHSVYAKYWGGKDDAPSSSPSVSVQGLLSTTTVNLQVSPKTAARGQAVQFTATISPSADQGYTPTGTVTFSSGSRQLASIAISQAKATLTTAELPVGSQNITASYSGDSAFLPSTSPAVTLTVSDNRPSATNTQLQISPSSSVAIGSVITLSAQVTSEGSSLKQGQLVFCDSSAAYCENSSILGQAQLTASGTATIQLRLGVGQHSFKAVFQGAGQYASSTSNVQTVTVTGLYPTATKIYWKYDTLLSAVTSYGKDTPSGTVSFQDQTFGSSLGKTQVPGFETWFTPEKQTSLNIGVGQQVVAAADFNKDGVPDIASGNADGTVSVALGKGDGTFTRKPNISIGAGIAGISTSDFNHDGIPDLAVAFSNNLAQDLLTILLGNGDGTFRALPVMDLTGFGGDGAQAIAVADFDGDGTPDLAVIGSYFGGGGDVRILLGNGDGTFSLWNVIDSPTTLYMAIGDFNGDRIPDLALVESSSIIINPGLGDGTFTTGAQFNLATSPSSIIAGDFNADGILDLATTAGSYDQNGNLLNGTVTLSLGKGDGTFTTTSPINLGSQSVPQSITVADFNGDGRLDIATVGPPPAGDSSKGAGILTYLFGRGNGTFSKPDPFYNWGYNGIATADFDGDGVPDLSITNSGTNSGTNSVGVFLSAKTTFSYISNVKLPGSGAQSVYASYSGDASHATSKSGTITITPPTR